MAKSLNRAIRIGYDVVNFSGTIVKVIEYDTSGAVRRSEGLTVPTAGRFAKGAIFVKTNAASGTKSIYENQGTTSTPSFDLMGSIAAAEVIVLDAASFVDSNGNEALTWGVTASAVNNLKITNAATGTDPTFEAIGGNANVGIRYETKGTGEHVFYSDEAGATGAVMVLRQDSASPAAADVVGRLRFDGEDAAGAQTVYARIDGIIRDTTNATEDGDLEFLVMRAGTVTKSLALDSDVNGVIIGDGAATAIVRSSGNFDLQLDTGNATTSKITITDGAAGNITFSPDTTGEVVLENTDVGTTGSVLRLTHQGGSQANADIVGRILFTGEDDAVADEDYGRIDVVVDDVAAANPDSDMSFLIDNAGTLTERLRLVHTANAVQIGDGAAAAILMSSGNFDLTLQTGNATSSSINIVDGAAGDVQVTLDGAGQFNIGASTGIVGVLDEDLMGSDSATNLATQQSIKAYVDAQIAASDSLQEAFLVGNTITAADTTNVSLVFTQNDVTNNPDALQINNAGTGDEGQFTSTNAGAAGVVLRMHHDSASPAVSDVVGSLVYDGEDDASGIEEYGRIDVSILDATAANPDGRMSFYADVAGTATELLRLDNAFNGIQVGAGGAAGFVASNGAANISLLTGSGTGGVILVTDGAAGGVKISPDTTGEFEIENIDTGAVGSVLRLDHFSASPAISDVVARIIGEGRDSGAASTIYGQIDISATAVAAGTESGRVSILAADGTGALASAGGFQHDGTNGQVLAGDGATEGQLRSAGAQDLRLGTGSANGGIIVLADGAVGGISLVPDAAGMVTVVSTDAGALGSQLTLGHQGGSQAGSDVAARILFRGEDDAVATEDYARIDAVVTDAAAANPDGDLVFYGNVAGTLTEKFRALSTLDGLQIGSGAAAGVLSSNGNFDLTFQTGNGTTGNLNLVDGANGDFEVKLNGSGAMIVDGDAINTGRVGTEGTNVTAEEFGDGRNHTTVLTLTATAMGTIAGAGAAAFGALVYTFPAGVHIHEVSYMTVGVTTAGGTKTDTPELGIGSLIGSGANATLNAVGATAHDYVTATAAADANGTALVLGPVGAVAGLMTGISLNKVGDTKALNFNAADTWAAGAAGALTADGTITIKWTSLEA